MTNNEHDYGRYIPIPYIEELGDLPSTYRAAMNLDVDKFANWLIDNRDRPLIAIGAGGSLAIAEIAAFLHNVSTGNLAKSAQPMAAYTHRVQPHTAALQIAASGSHGDGLAIADQLPRTFGSAAVFCGSEDSQLGAAPPPGLASFAFPLLPQVHSWVAVNVLLAQAVVLTRAYGAAFPDTIGALPQSFDYFQRYGSTAQHSVATWRDRLAQVLERPALVCLFGPGTVPFAVDLDSKFAESGLGELSLSEYRNFAHGRYQSTLNRQNDFGVLAVSTAVEATIAKAVVDSLPDWLPHEYVEFAGGNASINIVDQLVQLLYILGALAEVRGVEIGWGSRGTYGDSLYEALPKEYLYDYNS